MNRPNIVALEMIQHQTGDFFDTLSQLFKLMMDKKYSASTADSSKERSSILSAIKKYTNLNINLTFNTEMPPCVRITAININTPIFRNSFIKYSNEDYDIVADEIKKNRKENVIDFKNSKVYGVFEQFEAPIYMSWDFLIFNRISAEECAAILLHEIGHVFVNLEIIDRGILANQILTALAKAGNNIDKKKYVLQAVGDSIEKDKDAYSAFTEIKDNNAVSIILIGKIREKLASELKSANYDNTSFEALADNFAVRHGAGRYLVTGLDKIISTYGYPEKNSYVRLMAYAVEILSIIGTALVLMGTFTPVTTSLFVTAILNFMMGGENYKDYTYDSLKVRYLRVREQIIDSLKNKYLPKSEKEACLSAVERIDKALESCLEFKPLLAIAADFLITSNRNAKAAIETQRKLEDLASNELFVKATQLSI